MEIDTLNTQNFDGQDQQCSMSDLPSPGAFTGGDSPYGNLGFSPLRKLKPQTMLVQLGSLGRR